MQTLLIALLNETNSDITRLQSTLESQALRERRLENNAEERKVDEAANSLNSPEGYELRPTFWKTANLGDGEDDHLSNQDFHP